ncbi:hypothetical protein GQ602_004149 [Ophiocordyceps camponoti-floridani]|uniref:Uncharacterized protein n=1 Tax=Ophiocordyceps camponoti-floridani TaxID=2030778 RepID=A0A8H4Q680_9HYPO|nr:hypothetical protein GQ602_004149 [Ophiocordyceps camponoti-floridani]
MSFSGQTTTSGTSQRSGAKKTLSNMFRRNGTDEKQLFISETDSVSSHSTAGRQHLDATSKPKRQSKTPRLPTLVMPPIRYYN